MNEEGTESGTSSFEDLLEHNRLLTIKELAALFSVSTVTIRRSWFKGLLPAPVKIGNQTIRWPAEDIKEWMANLPRSEIYEGTEARTKKLI